MTSVSRWPEDGQTVLPGRLKGVVVRRTDVRCLRTPDPLRQWHEYGHDACCRSNRNSETREHPHQHTCRSSKSDDDENCRDTPMPPRRVLPDRPWLSGGFGLDAERCALDG